MTKEFEEALKCLENLADYYDINYFGDDERYQTIKQALLKTKDLEKENKKMKALLLELSDINPDNVDCVNQCISVVNTILENNISEEINKACESNLRVLKEM